MLFDSCRFCKSVCWNCVHVDDCEDSSCQKCSGTDEDEPKKVLDCGDFEEEGWWKE